MIALPILGCTSGTEKGPWPFPYILQYRNRKRSLVPPTLHAAVQEQEKVHGPWFPAVLDQT